MVDPVKYICDAGKEKISSKLPNWEIVAVDLPIISVVAPRRARWGSCTVQVHSMAWPEVERVLSFEEERPPEGHLASITGGASVRTDPMRCPSGLKV